MCTPRPVRPRNPLPPTGHTCATLQQLGGIRGRSQHNQPPATESALLSDSPSLLPGQWAHENPAHRAQILCSLAEKAEQSSQVCREADKQHSFGGGVNVLQQEIPVQIQLTGTSPVQTENQPTNKAAHGAQTRVLSCQTAWMVLRKNTQRGAPTGA